MPLLGKYFAAYPASHLKGNLWCMTAHFTWSQRRESFAILIEQKSWTPFDTYFSPKFAFPLLSRGCADFRDTYTPPILCYFCGAILNLKTTGKHFKRRAEPTACPSQGSVQLCSKNTALLASFSIFLFGVHWNERIAGNKVLAEPLQSQPLKGSKVEINRVCLAPARRSGSYWFPAREQPCGGKVQRGAPADRLPPW